MEEVWIIRRHNINSNDISKPERAILLEQAPGWCYYIHWRVRDMQGRELTVPEERIFKTTEELLKFLDNILKAKEKSYETSHKRYIASLEKLNTVKSYINELKN